jgi:hypothetical protein
MLVRNVTKVYYCTSNVIRSIAKMAELLFRKRVYVISFLSSGSGKKDE